MNVDTIRHQPRRFYDVEEIALHFSMRGIGKLVSLSSLSICFALFHRLPISVCGSRAKNRLQIQASLWSLVP